MTTTNLSNTTSARERIESRVDPAKSGAITVGAGGAMQLGNMGEIMEFAKLMSCSGVAVPKHLRENPGACLAVVIQASEWQMSPYSVANKSYSVNDRLAYEAQLVAAVILRRAPIKGRIKYAYEGDGEKRVCTVTVTCTDGEVVEHRSPMFGNITPKNSPLWKADADQQLGYHTVRSMCRRHFPDVLLGVYTMDELQDTPQAPRTATGRVVSDNPIPRVETRTTFDDLQEPAAIAPIDFPGEPEPAPEPSLEPVRESPLEVSPETERESLVAVIREFLLEQDIKMTVFAPACRKAGLLGAGVQLIDLPADALRVIAENRLAILEGTYKPA